MHAFDYWPRRLTFADERWRLPRAAESIIYQCVRKDRATAPLRGRRLQAFSSVNAADYLPRRAEHFAQLGARRRAA